MTDIDTTTIPAISFPRMEAPAARPEAADALARAQAAERAAVQRVVELENQLRTARNEQITDGADPRLADFWERAGRIADHAHFCDEYDRLAEAMSGTPRVREWEVTAEVVLRISVSQTIEARTAGDAESEFRDRIGDDELIEAIRYNSWEIDIEEFETERA